MPGLFSRMRDNPFADVSRIKRLLLLAVPALFGILTLLYTRGAVQVVCGLAAFTICLTIFASMVHSDLSIYVDELGSPYEPQRWKIGLPTTLIAALLGIVFLAIAIAATAIYLLYLLVKIGILIVTAVLA